MIAIHLATQLTAIAVPPPPANMPVDPELKDPLTQARNAQVAEVWKVFYDFTVKALNGDKPAAPAIPAGASPLAAVLSALVLKIPGAAAIGAALPSVVP